MSLNHYSLASLKDSVESLIHNGDFNTPLEMLQAFVERVIAEPMSIGRVLDSPLLDALCFRVGEKLLSQMNVASRKLVKGRVVYVATEFYRHGGHTLVAADFVRLMPDHEHVFLMTDVLANPHDDAADLRLNSLGALVEVAPAGSKLERLRWLLSRLFELAPERVYWFNHHQDAVAVAAAQAAIRGEKYFIHHADHQLCLGVHARYLRHVDLHNIGFFNCRDILGITDNRYLPLVCDDLGGRSLERPFIKSGKLRTCSSGSGNKFEVLYLHDYADLIARVLHGTGGDHIHIGYLSEKYLERIRGRLAEEKVPQERFVHVPWVPSLWRVLIEQEVDVYLASWPIGGGRALIESMGAGIPSIVHVSYISRFHSGFDLSHPAAPTWHTPAELVDQLAAFTPDTLVSQSLAVRAHYERHHDPKLLASLLRGDGQNAIKPTPLRDYSPDTLQVFLDERTQTSRAVAERDEQIDKFRRTLAERDEQIDKFRRTLAERDEQIDRLNHMLLAETEKFSQKTAQITFERERLASEMSHLRGKVTELEQLTKEKARQIFELSHSESYRFGLFCTWPLRKIWKVIRCVGGVRSLSLIVPPSARIEPRQNGESRQEPLHDFLMKLHRPLGRRSYAAWKIARYFYRRVPLPFRMKLKIKGLFFRYFGRLVTPTSLWTRVETRPLTAQMNSRPAHYEMYVRADAALDEPAIAREFQGAVDAYQAWVDVNIWNYRREERLRSRLRELDMSPFLSVVMPVYNPPVEWLNRAIETVRCQVYTNWELCIADDASTNGEVRTALIKWAEDDERIKVCYRERNGNISAATNSAASLATGSHLVFLDQDDELTPDALGEIALYIAAHSEADVVYSDDDKIDAEGRRFAPQFKPDWSPELLLSYMYFSHVFVVSRKLFEEVGGTRIGFEGSQDYDLALRVSEKARHVGHISLILYHWRVLPGSTASSGKAKPDSMEAGKRAVHEALQRRAVNAAAYQPDWALRLGVGIFSHRFSLSGQPRVTIIIPTKDQADVLKRCISSILEKTDYHNYDILIIDNESAEQKTTRYLNKISKNNKVRTVRISNPEGRFSFAYINNRAVRSTSSEYVLFLNNDTEVLKKDWLTQMVGYARIPGVGAVGARLFYPDKRIQHAGVLIKFYHGLAGHAFKGISKQDPGYLAYAKALRNYSAVTAACLLTPRKLFLETGGFDDRNFSVAYNDVDYCGRLLEKGYRVVYSPEAELVHHEGFSRGFCDEPRENVNFKEKYYRKKDRYYSRSLSLDNEYFEVWPRAVFSGEFRKTVRVLMCAHNLNHEGAPSSQYEMTVGLNKKGVIEPVVFSPSDGPLRALYESQGIKVIVDEGLGAVFYPAAYHERVKAFAAFIKGLGVEMVYANTVVNFHAIAAAGKAGVPSLWNIRESEQWQYYKNWWGTELAGEAARCFAYPYKVIFVAHTTKHVYCPFEWRHNFHVIYNGLNLDHIYGEAGRYDRKAVRKDLGISDDELAVLLPGTICERKGQHDLVRALALLGPECLGKIRCFIVGETEGPLPYSKELHAIADSLPAAVKERLSILPITSEIFKFYKAADIIVCTSKIESFPRIILEAMAFDLPIVTTPVFGIQEQVQQGVNALFYPPGDPGALAKALESLITDEGMRRRFSENSKYVLRQLQTFDEMVAEYETLFREAYLSLGPRARMPECIHIYRTRNSPRQSPVRKVSFLTSYKDENSQRFRVYNLIEELTRHGVECAVIKQDCAGSLDRVLDSDVLVAFRVASSPNVRRILDACGRAGVPTVFDVDDLVFEPESADLLHGVSALGKADRIKAVEGLWRLRETLLACDYATCTTKALAGRIEHLEKRCFVIPNTINRRQLELAREIRKSGKRADDSRIRMGYFSGTKTHERDFMEVSDALYEVMEKNPRVEFHLVGTLDLDPKFSVFGKRIIQQPLMDYLEMLRYLAGMDINLAPLEMNNIFTGCKSELKIFESALLGIPTVASATESYAGCITDDVNGFLAGSKDEWVKKLDMITRDAALRRRIAGQAEQDFVKRYSIENVITDVVGTYAQIASNRRITNEARARHGK